MAELKTFLFTDICGSVNLKNEMIGRSVTERDMAFIQNILLPHREGIEAHLEAHGGRVVSTAGDGHFLVFDNTIQAAQWAVDVQRIHRDQPIETPHEGSVEVRISMHVGVPQSDPADPNNFVGKSVDYASRLNDYATGGQILISRSVMAILDDVGLDDIAFHLHGRRELKGIGRVEVHELLYDQQEPQAMRPQPKSHTSRQWTVIPTMGFEASGSEGSDVALAAAHALKRAGNYELEGLLGSGGMGDVYKGRHIQFNRIRAIKVIKPQFVAAGNQEIIRRFYQEIKAVGALEHKNIVVAIDSSSQEDRVHYLVMEYIDGVGLHDLVDQHGPLLIADACEIIRQAARGLQYIHRNGMVHRDIKPSNLMLTLVEGDGMTSDSSVPESLDELQGVVKILDLGLALLSDDNQERLTRFDNKAMGTGMYMSPEQWKTTSVDIRADIYSLGCTLYHLLAGNPPFIDSDLRPEKAHEKSAVPPIRNSMTIPNSLWAVLSKMLAKKTEQRYATPAEVVTALAPFTEGHNLLELVLGYNSAEPTTKTRVTQTDSGARVDTWWSRASGMYPSRRWLLRTALPLAIVAGVVIGGASMLMKGKKRVEEVVEASARANLTSFAKQAATRSLPEEIIKRFEILTLRAKDKRLREALVRINQAPENKQFREPLDEWIRDQKHSSTVEADSWFINDRTGIQVARSPKKDSVGKNYRHRDYFHGKGLDIDPEDSDKLNAAEPIHDVNLSAVYASSTSRNLKVAFSVPIWNDDRPGAQSIVLGVLSMSVNVADFEVLAEGLEGDNEVVLVDLRRDTVQDEPRRGLILHHPKQRQGQLVRIDSQTLAQIDEANPLSDGFAREYQFLRKYPDPLDQEDGSFYWGAFEPVQYQFHNVRTGEDQTRRPGWIVLVQSRVIK